MPLVAGVELGGTTCMCILASAPDAIVERVVIGTTTPEETLGAIEAVGFVRPTWQGLRIAGSGCR